MRTKFSGFLTLLLAFVVQITFAQEKTVTGTVTDDQGLPLPGVNVVIQDTDRGTQSDFDGNYTINASEGETLVFSYVGFSTQTIEVGQSNSIDVQLIPGNTLEDVIVTAYGTKERDQLTSAVSVVTGEELTQMSPTTSVDNMLQGRAPGVQVTAGNGKPGQTAFVRIRGVGSINASSAPLYVIDGVVAPNLNSINPNEIESMSILKDAATASKYGSRAANGVIVITTKKGGERDAVVTYNTRYGFSQMVENPYEMMNAEQKIRYERELAALGIANAQGLTGPSIQSQEEYEFLIRNGHDWQETLLRRGVVQSNQVSISGGTEKMSYFSSVGHDKNEGIIDNIDGFERLSARLNADYQAKDWLRVGGNVSVTTTSSDEPRDRNNVQNPFRAMYDYNPYETEFLIDDNGALLLDENGDRQYNPTRQGFSISEALVNNPEDNYSTTTLGRMYANLKFSDHFSNDFSVGASHIMTRREYFVKPGSILDGFVGDAENPGSKTDNGSFDLDYTLTNIFTYRDTFAEDHNLQIQGLFEFNRNTFRTYRLSSIGFVSGDLSVQSISAEPTAVSTTSIEASLMGIGGFLDYDYKRKYLATASVRRDESSVFGANNKYGVFWSASAAWNIDKESFMEDSFMNRLKLRASAGTSGNRAGIGYYTSRARIGFGSLNGLTTAVPTDNGNPDLGFEKNFIWDVGVEFGMFNNRLRGTVDYYQRTTSDLLLNRPLLALGGEPDGSILSNIGEMQNKGIEIELSGDLVATKDWRVRLGGNIAFVDNEVTELVSTLEFPNGAPITGSYTRTQVGEEINTFYLPKWGGVNPANGQPLFYDANGNLTTEYDADANYLLSDKSPIAEFDGGINLFASYKGFELGADFYYKVGHYTYNIMESNMLSDGTGVDANQRVDAFNYWTTPGQTNVLPSPVYGNEAQQVTDRFLQKADYVRLRNLTFGYNIPSKFLEKTVFSRIRAYVQGQNLWVYAPHFKGDPEVGIGSGETDNFDTFGAYNLYSYPTTQTISFGLDVQF
ncbi:SusC/RagA family TonB-linked outer membrane protein [Mesonia sp.]|uniref:SusC/RagA family TonB-linked outer membrane protein n=1 Tax=Mesonia sp. TaxID=1960830 RepID=UPI0017661BAB|nr:SusC/RagA family TonB-linked outer membrane protein [Mesonia sp.]HIB37026.1 SusC/RagA family TonB-linked outer membrane protein [Mesonia sp.]